VVEAARAEGAAAIVVGSHRRGRLGRLLAGSVSSDIAEHADCPVHIVPGDGDGDEDGARIASVRPASAAVD
jgi:nucleotide-binding universal stress UspA family protein